MDGARDRARGAGPSQESGTHPLSLLEHITTLVGESGSLQETLDGIVQVVAGRMETEVCSLYLYDGRGRRLTLCATTGLDPTAVGKVSLAVGEGLTGTVVEKMEPVMVVDAPAHPRYRYFPETAEEQFHSFLGVPIRERGLPLGVLVVQTRRRRRFSPNEIRLLKAIAAQAGGILVQARLAESLQATEKEREAYRRRLDEAMRRLRRYEGRGRAPAAASRAQRLDGLAASPGFGMGRAHIVPASVDLAAVEESRCGDPAAEVARFRSALERSVEQVERLKRRLRAVSAAVDGAILDAHRMMLEDKVFASKVEAVIQEGWSAETALKRVVEAFMGSFVRMSEGYLRERAIDIRDIGLRVLRNLLGIEERALPLRADAILVAEELTLTDLSLIDHPRIKGIALATGGVTSHAAILAKSFEIPTVVGVDHATDIIHEGDHLIIDGNAGVVFVNPTADVEREYERLVREYRVFNRQLEAGRDLPAETRDGYRIALYANIGLLSDVSYARRHGAEGIGLYRTEVPFMSYSDFPDEEEQVALYTSVIDAMEDRPVTIRTLDIGADKYPTYLRSGKEENPFLGWRSIRVSLEMADLFRVQLRAILRAATRGKVRILFPMISSVDEVLRARELLEQAKADLGARGVPFDPTIEVGIMVEVPSAVWLATRLVQEVDFFSIGTNDLIQYLLAVDRNNRKVAPLYEPLHPAVLMAVNEAVQAAKGAGKWVGMCGEMAADPLAAIVLLGMGLHHLSMGPFFIPVIKRLVRSVTYSRARAVAREVMTMGSVKEIKGYLFEEVKSLGVMEIVEMYR